MSDHGAMSDIAWVLIILLVAAVIFKFGALLIGIMIGVGLVTGIWFFH
jgi:hypothetical protein